MSLHEQAKAWRQMLQAGNGVVIREKNQSLKICAVERVTATQVIVLSPHGTLRRFSKERGTEVGTSYGPTIEPITDEARARIIRDRNRQIFSTLCCRPDRLTDQEIAVMVDALTDLRASKEDGACPSNQTAP